MGDLDSAAFATVSFGAERSAPSLAFPSSTASLVFEGVGLAELLQETGKGKE